MFIGGAVHLGIPIEGNLGAMEGAYTFKGKNTTLF
jgi:hypothetical protein